MALINPQCSFARSLVQKLKERCGSGGGNQPKAAPGTRPPASQASIKTLAQTPTIGVEMDTLVTAKPRPKHVFEMREIGGIMVQL